MQNRMLPWMVMLTCLILPLRLLAGGPDVPDAPPEPEGYFSIGFTGGAAINDNVSAPFITPTYQFVWGVNAAYRFMNQNDIFFNFFDDDVSNSGSAQSRSGFPFDGTVNVSNSYQRELLQFFLGFGHWFSLEPSEHHTHYDPITGQQKEKIHPYGAVHPFFGLDITNLNQTQSATFTQQPGATATLSSSVNTTPVGPAAGIDIVWNIIDCFSIDGRGYVSILYANPSETITLTDSSDPTRNSTTKTNLVEIIPHLHGEIGLAYGLAFSSILLRLSVGYQMDTYIGIQLASTATDVVTSGNVGYSGPFGRLVLMF